MKEVTLLYLRRGNQVLLGMKKRGFGKNKWNGPGGKVEPGESILEAAVRECQEEIGVRPLDTKLVGKLHFFMPDDPGFEHRCSVFLARDWEGEPIESDELRPEWFDKTNIPYHDMWPDDIVWMPLLLAGRLFAGTIHTSESELVSHTIKPVDIL